MACLNINHPALLSVSISNAFIIYGKEVNFCVLVILSNIIDGCDRFLAFN